MPKPKGIMPAFIHYRGVPQLFMQSMVDSYRAGVFQHPYAEASSSRTNAARTENGRNFLESDAEFIFLVDTDMVWDPEAIITLHQFAKKENIKAVSGWALMLKNGAWPHAMKKTDLGNYQPFGHIEPFSSPIKVDAAGGACFLVHRDVYQTLSDQYSGSTEWPWQDDVYMPDVDQQMGEDVVFSDRVTRAGYDIWYHPDAIFTHLKTQSYGPQEYLTYYRRLLNHGNIHASDVQPAG